MVIIRFVYISTHPLTILSNLKKFKDLFIFHFQDNDNIYALMDVSYYPAYYIITPNLVQVGFNML